jgi:hypothetical protein
MRHIFFILLIVFCMVASCSAENITNITPTPTYHYYGGGGGGGGSYSAPVVETTTQMTTQSPTVVPTTFKEQVYVNPVLTTFPPTIQTTNPIITMDAPSEAQGSIWDLWWLWLLLIIIAVVIVVYLLTR